MDSGVSFRENFSFPSGDDTDTFCCAQRAVKQNKAVHKIKSFFIVIYLSIGRHTERRACL